MALTPGDGVETKGGRRDGVTREEEDEEKAKRKTGRGEHSTVRADESKGWPPKGIETK